jgi:hypothetical protein
VYDCWSNIWWFVVFLFFLVNHFIRLFDFLMCWLFRLFWLVSNFQTLFGQFIFANNYSYNGQSVRHYDRFDWWMIFFVHVQFRAKWFRT